MSSYPYTYFQCPCANNPLPEPGSTLDTSNDDSQATEEDEKAFNPHDPRANFSLYPLEHLMWCESCHEIRCPRCVVEEIVCWFCPGCGFEVASSMVKSEGNRCTRNCYNCPICTAGLFVNSLDMEGGGAPWILACEHCNWTSLDIGITFEKPNNIHGQLAKMLGKARSKVMRMLDEMADEKPPDGLTPLQSDPDARFNQLLSFYKSELGKENPTGNIFMSSPGGNVDYSSPSSFARIMSLYTNTGNYGKKATAKTQPMRAAADASEGLVVVDRAADQAVITRIHREGLLSLTTSEQRMNQPHNPRFRDEMLPQATLLSTKRSRRCRTCRHILVKPEAKVSNTRYRIKLIALSHIPTISMKPLLQPPTAPQQPGQPSAAGSFDWKALPPNRPLQFLLTLTNPLFEAVRVTLATPTQTPGRFSHKVTILCPQFTLGANADVWDEALGIGTESRRSSKLLTKPIGSSSSTRPEDNTETKVAEAGKIWDKGRNWTSVVLEVVCQRVDDVLETELSEDEDVVQIPLFVRLEYEQAGTENVGKAMPKASADDGTLPTGDTAAVEAGKIKRELAYWTVLGIGKVSRLANR